MPAVLQNKTYINYTCIVDLLSCDKIKKSNRTQAMLAKWTSGYFG